MGKHQLEVAAIGSGMSDAVRREVEVVPDGVPFEQAASGSWLTGEPYRVQMADGSTELTRDWLAARLAEYRQRQRSGDAR